MGGGVSTPPYSYMGENAGTWAWMLNMRGLGFQALGHGGQRQCSGVLMSDLRKMGKEDGVMEGGGEEKK